MTLSPDELLQLLAAVAKKDGHIGKDLRSAMNQLIVRARVAAQNPALRSRAKEEMRGLEYAASVLEAAMRRCDG